MEKQNNSYKCTIWGRFPSLNEFIAAVNRNRHAGNTMKRDAQKAIIDNLLEQWGKVKKIDRPIKIHYTYYEPNKKRDLDNISGWFHKVFQDALVQAGVIVNDSWQYVRGYSDDFELDSLNPRIEIVLEEVDE